MRPVAAGDSEERRSPASAGRLFGAFGLRSQAGVSRRPRIAGGESRRSCSCTAMAIMRRCGSPRLWRMESNGVPRERMARDQFHRSAGAQRRQGGAAKPFLDRRPAPRARRGHQGIEARTGASRIALVGNSRGGYSIRNYIKNGGGADISHAVLCGVPNHGVYDWDDGLGGEFNGRGPFLRGLNEGESEVTPGTAFLTLAQRRQRQVCASRRPLRRQAGHADRRDVGGAGAEGRDQSRARRDRSSRDRVSSARVSRDLQIHRRPRAVAHRHRAGSASQAERACDGHAGRRCRPTARSSGATVEIYRVSAETGERAGGPIHSSQTGADGRWGPAQVEPSWYLEIVLTSAGAPTTHFYRSPFPRSSDIVHLRAARPLGPADAGAGAVVLMSRPRGYFGLPRDVVLIDGKEPKDVKSGRADRFGHDLAASCRGGWPGGGGPVQYRSESWRGPGRHRKTGLRLPN